MYVSLGGMPSVREHRVLFIGFSPPMGFGGGPCNYIVALFVSQITISRLINVPDKQPESAFRRGLRVPRLNKYSSSFLHTKKPNYNNVCDNLGHAVWQ